MPTFSYKAINRSGQSVQGHIDAENPQQASDSLARKGLFVDDIDLMPGQPQIDISTLGKKTYKIKLSDRDRAEFIRQLATALQAQIPLMTALQVVRQQNPRPVVKQLIGQLSDIVKSGQSLSFALSLYPRTFDKLHISMVAVGESTGSLDQSTTQLADLTESEMEIRSNITTAALYPAFVLCLGLLSVGIVVTWILPRILRTLAADVPLLPWPTRVIIAISDFLRSPIGWFFMGALVVLALFFHHWKKSPLGRYFWDRFKLKIPIFGTVQRKWAVSRFARTLGTLTSGGVNILDALKIVRNTLGNEVLAREVDQTVNQVRTGISLAKALQHSGVFPPLLIQIATLGEQTGQLSKLLQTAADAFDRDTQVAIKRFMAIFPAILILVLALVIGFIVAATLLPIVQIDTAITGLQ